MQQLRTLHTSTSCAQLAPYNLVISIVSTAVFAWLGYHAETKSAPKLQPCLGLCVPSYASSCTALYHSQVQTVMLQASAAIRIQRPQQTLHLLPLWRQPSAG